MKNTEAAKAALARQLALFPDKNTQAEHSKAGPRHADCDNVKRSTVIPNGNVIVQDDSENVNGENWQTAKAHAGEIAFTLNHPEGLYRWVVLSVAFMVEGVPLNWLGLPISLSKEDEDAAIRNANMARPKKHKTAGDAAAMAFLGEIKRRVAKLIDYPGKPEELGMPSWKDVKEAARRIGYDWRDYDLWQKCSPHPPEILRRRNLQAG